MESILVESAPDETKTYSENPTTESLLKNTKTIQDLPVEMLNEVFGYLTHTEKLISRLVCTGWNHQISPGLGKKCCFEVSTEETIQVLENSNIEWTNIRLSNFGLKLPEKNINTISTLRVLQNCGLKESMEAVIGFPKLTSLDLIIGVRGLKAMVSRKKGVKVEFHKFAEKLKSLIIRFNLKNFGAFCGFMKELDAEKMNLTELSIEETMEDDDVDLKDGQQVSLMSEIYRIIFKSSKTLKKLELDCGSGNIQKKMIPKLVEKLCTVEDLKLETLLIPANSAAEADDDGFDVSAFEADFRIYEKFMKIQIQAGSVKSMTLPWSPNQTQCKTFSGFLPQNVNSVWCVEPVHLTEDFPSRFKKLEFMSILSQELYTFSQPCPSVRRLTIHYLWNDISENPERISFDYDRIYSNLGASLINLVELVVERNGDIGFGNTELRLVVENFPQLRILQIDCLGSDNLTDDGVAGFKEYYSDELIRTRRLYHCEEISEDNLNGAPLNSLKNLERLVLKGANISDAGIYYGLRFGLRLKHMTLLSTSSEVSEWGLKWLGSGNPGLESFCGHFETEHVSKTRGIEILKGHLPLTEYTRKLKLKIDGCTTFLEEFRRKFYQQL